MAKYVIEEISAEACRFDSYFDCDCYSEAAGDFGYTVFALMDDARGYSHNWWSAINEAVFEDINKKMDYLFTDVWDFMNGYNSYNSVKEILCDYGIPYNPNNSHRVKVLADSEESIDQFIGYLELTTGKKWDVCPVYGYCQGDFIEVVYCKDFYKDHTAEVIGEIALGCGKEFCVKTLDDNGDEIDSVYGFIVADCEASSDEDYKNLVCEWAGINPADCELKMIDSYSTVTIPHYRTA